MQVCIRLITVYKETKTWDDIYRLFANYHKLVQLAVNLLQRK